MDLKISTGGAGLPLRMVFYAPPGLGKTSFGAAAPKPIFLMTRGETGLETLIDLGVVPPTAHAPECLTWLDFSSAVGSLKVHSHDFKTLVIDTVNGAQQLLVEKITKEKFGGDQEKFAAFGRGWDPCEPIWTTFLEDLAILRRTKKMRIILLCHSKIKKFANPEGEDYDRHIPDMNERLWGRVDRWADMVLFGNYEQRAKQGKGVGGPRRRWIYTSSTAAFDAKNRCGLPDAIPMDPDGASAFAAIVKEMAEARQANPFTISNVSPTAKMPPAPEPVAAEPTVAPEVVTPDSELVDPFASETHEEAMTDAGVPLQG